MTGANGLPNFFVIGAAKSGTTSLYHYLRQHPQIFMSPIKEPRFFALEGDPLDWRGPGDERYRAKSITTLDAYRALFEEVNGEPAVGEASVLYLDHPEAPDRIARRIPEARLIAVLRNPAEKAYSSYLFKCRDGDEQLEFEDALRAEPQRIADGWYWAWRYRSRGFYHGMLRRYFERFDRSQIRVYLYEDFSRDPGGLLADAFRFLEVDDGFRPDLKVHHNVSGRPRSPRLQRLLTRSHPVKEAAKSVIPEDWGHRVIARLQRPNLMRPAMRPDTRADLLEAYRDDIGRLEELIDRDLSHWLR
jgi:hypothetical protein